MLKKQFVFTAQSLLHTGADTKLGTISPFRRTKYNLPEPITIKTRFKDYEKDLKKDAFSLLYLKLWDCIEDRARKTIYEEFQNKTLQAAYHNTKEAWLTRFCDLFSIKTVSERTDDTKISIVELLDLFSDYEFLEMVRKENQFLVAKFRNLKDKQKLFYEATKNSKEHLAIEKGGIDAVVKIDPNTKKVSPVDFLEAKLFDIFERDFFESDIVKTYDYIPYISGNSIRGKLRRLVMQDFCKAIGINEDRFNIEEANENETHITFTPQWYHRLFTGGALDESNAFDDISEREKIIQFCPMLGLFGSAIGRQTIEGCLNVSVPILQCKELGTGIASYNDLIHIDFSTRLDSEKTNKTIEIAATEKKKENVTQMKYEVECLIAGTKFDAGFSLNSDDKLMQIVFNHAINLFILESNICAKKSIGYGAITIENLEFDALASEKYYEYLQSKKDQILAFFKQ